VLLWGGITDKPFDIYWFIYAQTFTYSVTAITALIFLISKQKLGKLKSSKLFSLVILKQSAPYALLILLMTFYYRADSVMLERMLEDGKTQAGIYANGFRFFEAANNIAFLFATLLLPLFSNLLKNKESVASLTNLSSRILIPGAILIATTCFFFRQELIGARYLNSTSQSGDVFGLLMICFVFISTTYIFGTLLTANGNLKTLNKIAFAGVILNIILNLILIPTYKAYGAAIASVITQGITALAQIWLSKSYFQLKLNLRLIIRVSLFTTLLVCIGFILKTNLVNDLKWYVSFLMMLGIGFVILFLFKIIEIKNIKKLLLER